MIMNVWFESIKNGFDLYLKAAPLALIVAFGIIYIKKSAFNPVHFIGVQCLILYLSCLINVVLFPLPDAAAISTLNGYKGQYIPFKFVADIAKDKTIESVLQVAFNVMLTIPFGFFFKFVLNMKRRNIIILTFLLSLTIELAQLTGLFFIYPGSYRLFDVDDLMLNTLGGFAGTVLANCVSDLIPDTSNVSIAMLS